MMVSVSAAAAAGRSGPLCHGQAGSLLYTQLTPVISVMEPGGSEARRTEELPGVTSREGSRGG